MDYKKKYLKYKQKYIALNEQSNFVQSDSFKQKYIALNEQSNFVQSDSFKQKYLQLTGGSLPIWWNETISEATKLLHQAQSYEKNHTFFITGSTAIIFYLDLLLKKQDALSPAEKLELNEIINSIPKPDDLDLFYGSNDGMNLLYDIVHSIPPPPLALPSVGKSTLKLSLPTQFLDINTCPNFIDIGVFRECIENIERNAAKFEKKSGHNHIFSKIDINRLKYSYDQENPYKIVNINDTNILALDRLIDLYESKSNEDEISKNKIKILNFINKLLSK